MCPFIKGSTLKEMQTKEPLPGFYSPPSGGVVFFFFFFFQYAGLSLFGLSRCGAQAPDAQAQRPWLTGPGALRHVGSSGPGHEPASRALASGLPATAPPGKPEMLLFFPL